MSPLQDKTLIDGFVNESLELLDNVQPELDQIANDSSAASPQIIGAVLTAIHSIKNASTMLGNTDLQNFCLVLERVLVRLRRQSTLASPGVIATVLTSIAKLKTMVAHTPNVSEISYRQETTQLEDILGRRVVAHAPQSPQRKRSAATRQEGPHKVLVVEDNRIVGRLLQEKISATQQFVPLLATSMAEAREALAQEDSRFFVAVLDLNLPDAPDGEVVDFVAGFGIPIVILTGSLDDETRERVQAKKIVDYVVKTGASDLDYLVRVLKRLLKNQGIKIMVVEDSGVLRTKIRNLLELQHYQVVEAGDGEEALEILHSHPDVTAVITDYQMPHMDGLELVSSIRSRYSKNELAIIGISGSRSGSLTAKFLKSGANDFLVKPFLTEEFYCRVSLNIELVEMFDKLREASIRDPLTGLYNRRYFFDGAQPVFEEFREGGGELAMAIIDIDFFKKVNDTYGHDAGDVALRHLSRMLMDTFEKRGLLARLGGEEFGVLLAGEQAKGAQVVFDVFRKRLENTPVVYGGQSISLTVSVGLNTSGGNSLGETIKSADELLFKAKEAGRNQVCHQ